MKMIKAIIIQSKWTLISVCGEFYLPSTPLSADLNYEGNFTV
jgi:hypothetical protein